MNYKMQYGRKLIETDKRKENVKHLRARSSSVFFSTTFISLCMCFSEKEKQNSIATM